MHYKAELNSYSASTELPQLLGRTDKNLRRQAKAEHIRLGCTERSGRACFTSVMLPNGGGPQLSTVTTHSLSGKKETGIL